MRNSGPMSSTMRPPPVRPWLWLCSEEVAAAAMAEAPMLLGRGDGEAWEARRSTRSSEENVRERPLSPAGRASMPMKYDVLGFAEHCLCSMCKENSA
ncbi:hypothetical protein EUGRSUZ_L00624 [Eucalyptus grandis]|uniref:Uncharacterized protein n=1 Tax=Eucalyptus grandis TaxID=71139 RepID=A0A058ZV00_EUCGR|nr:hypothetical protein EUGRSUZ_L00624 [Eucalyptus grandis]